MSVWDDKELLDVLEVERASLRAKGKRLTFDCMNTIVRGDRVVCKERRMGIRGLGMPLLGVLKGTTAGFCRNCGFFTTEEV